MPYKFSENTSVVIIGGGLVGLSAGLFLQHLGVPFILVERNEFASPLPRSRGIAARTMELFRLVGLQESIEAIAKAAWKQGSFGGARRGQTMLSSEALPLPDIAKLRVGSDPSPCQMTACPQTLVEPILRQTLEERGADVRFGWELVKFEQDGESVRAVLRDPSGAERSICADYLLAADGARSGVRRNLTIGRQGLDADQHLLNIFFESDLATFVEGRTFSQCEIANDAVRGLFLAMNNSTEWSFHLLYDPLTEHPDRWSDEHIVSLLKAAIGADVEIALRHRSPWNTQVRVADRYREGRVFLVGDAAHSMPPWGGFNANTGIADAHNLAWKLKAALYEDAGPSLLDSYETERRPVASRNGEQARLRTDFDARFSLRTDKNALAFEQMLDYGELQMRYRYGTDDTVSKLRAQPGTRFPHAWIDLRGERKSTLDLFGSSFVSIGGPWSPKSTSSNAYRVGIDFQFLDEAESWHGLTGRPDDSVIHVRPDGFVTDSWNDSSWHPLRRHDQS